METFSSVITVYSELIIIKLISSWTAQEIFKLFPFFRRADARRRKWKSQTKHYRYKQLNKQDYFQKHDSAFYRFIVKISM